jgi:tetratricopeptide (TPR) repeat protein
MPLALELAAGWLDTLTLERVAAEIEQGLDILDTDLRDLPERHRSIRATFEQTWARLADDDRRVLRGLSVFRGGFTLDAARIVAGASLHSLRSLSHKALIQVQGDGRYGIHELLRQFGFEKLAQAGESGPTQSRHTAFYLSFMGQRQHEIDVGHQLEAVRLIDADFENVRLAWLSCVKQQAWEAILAWLDALWFYCEVRTRSQEGLDLLRQAEQVLEADATSVGKELILGRLWARLGWFYFELGLRERSVAVSDQAIRILRQRDQPKDLMAALYSRHLAGAVLHQLEARTKALQEGLGLAQSLGDRSWEGHFWVWSAVLELDRDDPASARPLAEAGLALFQALQNPWGLLRAYTVLGDVAESEGDYARARTCCRESLALSEAFGHQLSIGANHTHLGRIAVREGRYALAHSHLRAALRALWDAGYLWVSCFPLTCVALLFADQEGPIGAVEILATIDAHLTPFRRADRSAWALRAELESRLDAEQFAAAWARGQAREISTLIIQLLADL